MNIAKSLSVITAFFRRLELKKCLLRSAVFALCITALGLSISGSSHLPKTRDENVLAWDMTYAGLIICNGPPWYVLHNLGIRIIQFDGIWDGGGGDSGENPYLMSVFHEFFWELYFRFSIAWFILLLPITIAYQSAKLSCSGMVRLIMPKQDANGEWRMIVLVLAIVGIGFHVPSFLYWWRMTFSWSDRISWWDIFVLCLMAGGGLGSIFLLIAAIARRSGKLLVAVGTAVLLIDIIYSLRYFFD